MALGMGVNFSALTSIIHYGAPRCLDAYFQESGRAGREGEQSTSTIYWAPLDVPVQQDLRNAEVAVVRRYLENEVDCRRYLLLHYFDPALASNLERTCKAVADNWLRYCNCKLLVCTCFSLLKIHCLIECPLVPVEISSSFFILSLIHLCSFSHLGIGVDWWSYWGTCDGYVLGGL